MRRWVGAGAAAVAVVLSAGVTGAADASAAGAGPPGDEPDVAVVVWPGAGRTASWHAGEVDFDRLRSLLDPSSTATERVPDAWTRDDRPAVRFTVLWGLTGVGGWPQTRRAPGGDVAMLRQDQFFVAEDGTPWVRTDPAPDVADDDIRWHRVPPDVYARLAGGGFVGTAAPGAGGGDGGDGDGSWRRAGWAGAAGLGAGVAGTLLTRRAAGRNRTGPPRGGSRQELIDL